ncbi:MAG: TorD/DmsD family molecular chaperone [Planctomycetota bacterium]
MPQAATVRRSLYVLFARLLAGPPDAALYLRLKEGGLFDLARVQGVDLDSDLVDASDAESSTTELEAEYARFEERVSLRASDYTSATGDPVVAIGAFLREHRLSVDESGPELPVDHLSLALGIMGELAGEEESGAGEDAEIRARAFFLRHIQPWAQQALTELAGCAQRHFYRGLAAMISAFLGSEFRRYGDI